MNHSDFQIGCEFTTDTGRWRCTDIGTRTIVAIKIDPVELMTVGEGTRTSQRLSQAEAEQEGCFKGPPYKLAEYVFDENDIEDCEPT